MRLAADQADPDVDQRVTGRDAALHLGPDALLHARDELPWHRAAHHPVDELEPGPGRQGLDLDVADGVLAVPAGLLDVPAVPGGAARGTSPAARPGPARSPPRRRAGRAAAPAAPPGAPRPSHQTTIWWVPAFASTRTVGSSATSRARPCDSLSSSVLVRAVTARRQQRLRHRPRLHQRRARPGRTACPRSRPGASRAIATTSPATPRVDRASGWRRAAPRRRRSARPRRGRRARGRPPANRAKWPETCTVASGSIVPEKIRTRRQPADVGVRGGLHHLGHQRAVRVADQRLAGLAVRSGHGRQRVLQRRREAADDHLDQLGHAQPGRADHRDHRVERAAGDRRLQVGDQGLERRPPRRPSQRSSRVSSSDSWMIPSISAVRDSSIAVALLGVGLATSTRRPRSSRSTVWESRPDQAGRRARRRRAPAGTAAARPRRRPAGRSPARSSKSAALLVDVRDHDRPRHRRPRRTPPTASG